jgi:5,10-methylenetetrahydromethanopterin reductase
MPGARVVALITASGCKGIAVDVPPQPATATISWRLSMQAAPSQLHACGVALDGRAPIAEISAQARAAEEAGASTLWIACHLFLRDPITTAAMALSATRRVKVALMAMSPYVFNPVFIAMAAATLDEAFPGRVILSLGVGAPADLRAAGIAAPQALTTMAETIGICRALLAGEYIAFKGEKFRLSGRRLINGGASVPIVIAASGPRMLALAGRLADGVLISAATSVPFVRASLDHAHRGAAGRSVHKACIVYTRIGGDEAQAMDALRRPMGFVLRGAHHAENIRLSGAPLDQAALAAAYGTENWSEVDRLVSDDVVRRHAACGTPDAVGARLAAYRAIGLDEVIIGGIDDAKEIAAALLAAQSAP